MQTAAPSIDFVGIGAGDAGVEAVDRRRLDQIERLALGNAFHDVEQDDVTELLEPDQMRQRAADLPAPINAILFRAIAENSLIGKNPDCRGA